MTSCPVCDADIEVDDLDEFDVDIGDRLGCFACGARFEVVKVAPIELALEGDDGADDESAPEEEQSFGSDEEDDKDWSI